MGDYSEALSYYKKALEIQQKTPPGDDPTLAISYNNMGRVYENMAANSKTLSCYYERALNIWQRSLPHNHPYSESVKENIEIVKKRF